MRIKWTPSGLETGKILSYLRYLRILVPMVRREETQILANQLRAKFMLSLVTVCGSEYANKLLEKSRELVSVSPVGLQWIDKEAKTYGPVNETVRLADTPETIEGLNGYRIRELFHEAKGFISENHDIGETSTMLKAVELLGAMIESERVSHAR